ncbi:hypothetical protein TIFTF001_012513 [Ficus carica]|uniref:MADS-box domain-containing protein n=1 Tax=Ficus carica TaxID=3494 RepID=A0AA87ZZ57_FICCA|nr:hypothetical protein TIFTF001_012513 [Ficus carica]
MAGDQGNKQKKGKQKIAIKMIENESARQVTFSRRKAGILKKASEIVTLCGPEVGVVIFSPSGKPFSLYHPSPSVVMDKFTANNDGTPADSTPNTIVEVFQRPKIEELIELNDSLFNRLEEEKGLQKALKKKLNCEVKLPGQRQKCAVSEEAEEEEEDEEDEEEPEEEDKKQWWEVSLEGLAEDVVEERYKYFQELHNKFSNHIKERIANVDSTCSEGNEHNYPRTGFPPTLGYGDGNNNNE